MKMVLQIAALIVLTVLFAVQLPRRALFFKPRAEKALVPSAAFVSLSDATYREALIRARATAWSRRSAKWAEGGEDVEKAFFSAEETLTPLEPLPLPDVFQRRSADLVGYQPIYEPVTLSPVSFAAPAPMALPPLPTRPAAVARPTPEADDLDNYQTFNQKD